MYAPLVGNATKGEVVLVGCCKHLTEAREFLLRGLYSIQLSRIRAKRTLAAWQSGGVAPETMPLARTTATPPDMQDDSAPHSSRIFASLRALRAKSLTDFGTLHRPNRVYKHPGRVTRVLPTRGLAIAL